MPEAFEEVLLSPEAEAERLWRGAQEAHGKAEGNIAQLGEAIELGARVIEIITIQCLQKTRHEFPATVGALLESPPPEVEPERDFIHPPKSLRFVDVVDLLSHDKLPCISRGLHHGWEDRRESCRRAREWTRMATGFALSGEEREDLIFLGAYRNRIFQLPPPVRIVPAHVMRAWPTMVSLVERLFAALRAQKS